MKRVLITGAGGFIGGFIVAEALSRGYETWAAVRASTSRQFLQDERIKFVELDYSNSDTLRQQIADAIATMGCKWDYVVHNLGATKCLNFLDFNMINYEYMRSLVDILIELDATPEAFLMMSSLSVMGQGDEKGYTPFSVKQLSLPNTRYGVSKMKAETYLQSLSRFPYIIFRATGVYGPHERDYYLMMRTIKAGFDFSVGFKKQLLTFIYVKDLAAAIFDALESPATRRKIYIIAEPKSYTQKQFRQIVARELGKKFVIPVRCPLWALYAISWIAQQIGKFTLKPSTLNSDKYKIMKQRNWACDTTEAQQDFNFWPKYNLEAGVKEAIEWYKSANWL